MKRLVFTFGLLFMLAPAAAQAQNVVGEDRPNVKAYLDYLKQELTVTDERSSQSEVNPAYIRHNFNRVSALRTFALRLARETDTDYIPEMEAVTQKELRILFFDSPPSVADLKAGDVYNFSYRYLGSVRNVETFYIFARLDPYEEERVRREAEMKRTAEISDKKMPDKSEKSLAKTDTAADPSAQKVEKLPARDLFVTAEDKKKEIFLKKNPQD